MGDGFRPPPLLSMDKSHWALKGSPKALKGIIMVPNDQPTLCNVTKEKMPYGDECRCSGF